MKKRIFTILTIIILSLSVGLLSACSSEEHFKKETTYVFSEINLGSTVDLGELSGLLGGMKINDILDTNASEIKFSKDGKMSFKIILNSKLITIANLALSQISLEGQEESMQEYIDMYFSQLFPGFDIKNLPKSLDIIKLSLGIELEKFDMDDEGVKSIVESIQSFKKFDSKAKIPNGFGIAFNGIYEIKTLIDKDNNQQKAIYVGEHSKNTEPFLIMMLNKDSETEIENISFSMEFIQLNCKATKK